ncbi:MAG: Bug family tripartite tricarboxylate transporter substrate binding protein, partial [Burkholderiales bacterium]
YGPGGLADLLSRMVAERFNTSWGQPVIVENRPGANGSIGISQVVKSAPDGYTFATVPVANLAVNPHLNAKLPYDVFTDLAPVSLVASVHNVLVVNAGSSVTTARELVALAKSKPGARRFSTPGVSSQGHIAAEMFNFQMGLSTLHVPYNSMGAAIKDVLGGQVDFAFSQMPAALALIQGGKLRALGVASEKRSAFLPEVPTVAEATGVAQFEAVSWSALMAPAGTPEPIRAAAAAEIQRMLAVPEVRERLRLLGAEPAGTTPEELAKIMRDESARYGDIIRKAKIRVE